MSHVVSGLRTDRSQNAVLGATLTLPIEQANLLLTALAFLVTLAAGTLRVEGDESHVLGLQHQVVLRNSGTAIATMRKALAICWAWKGKGAPKLGLRTLKLFLPPLLVCAVFAVASIFVSKVALTDQSGATVARLKPNNCGFFDYDITKPDGYVARMNKITNDTLQARNYVNTFYNNATISSSESSFKPLLLPYDVDKSATCPFPNQDRCKLGHNGALAMQSGVLDSAADLGINAKPDDRTWIDGYFGSLERVGLPYTYEYEEATADTLVGYILDQNHIGYLQPTSDPWFTANITQFNLILASGFNLTGYEPNNFLDLMLCAEQYTLCNPVSGSCSAPDGLNQLAAVIAGNQPDLTPAQQATAFRISIATTYASLGIGGPHAGRLGAARKAYQALLDQCTNQLVRTTGEVQSFSFLGVMLVVCVSAAVVLLNLVIEPVMGCCYSRRRRGGRGDGDGNKSVPLPPAAVARQADSMLHLLRLALPNREGGTSRWEAGSWGVPVADSRAGDLNCPRYVQPGGGVHAEKGARVEDGVDEVGHDVDSLLLRE
ncbi:hypothetical protein BX600DRAFT_442867 [Xylariales sp. PMI_506]|nr:hypothetical protein BX600DRAFT_442867 [Xylariales sp. PMI_506]